MSITKVIRGASGSVLGYLHQPYGSHTDAGIRPTALPGRADVCPPEAILQVAAKRADRGRPSRPHRHLPVERSTVGTSEAWIVVFGTARARVRERVEDAEIFVPLRTGDCYVSVAGVHSLEVLDDALIYEIKNGPYSGTAIDKEWV